MRLKEVTIYKEYTEDGMMYFVEGKSKQKSKKIFLGGSDSIKEALLDAKEFLTETIV